MKKATIVLLLLLVFLFMLTGCSSGSSINTASSPSNSAGESKNDAIGSSADSNSSYGSTAQTDTRKVEKSAKVTVETLNYDDTNAILETLTIQYGGYVESSVVDGQSINNLKRSRTADYVLRIPQEKLDAFLSGAFTSGTVTQKTVTGVDVSQQYYDNEARLAALKIQQNSLMDMLKKATSTEDMIKINQSLSNVLIQIEQLTSTQRKIDSLVSMSTVRVTVKEVTDSTKTDTSQGFGAQLWNTFLCSLNAFAGFCKILVLTIIAILPFAVFFGIIAVIIIIILKRRNIKKRKNSAALSQMYYSQQIPQQNIGQNDAENSPKQD